MHGPLHENACEHGRSRPILPLRNKWRAVRARSVRHPLRRASLCTAPEPAKSITPDCCIVLLVSEGAKITLPSAPSQRQEGVRKLLDIILGDVFSFFRDSAPEAFECIKISISRLKQFSSAKSDIHKKIVDGLEARSSTRPDKWPHHLTTFYFQQLIHLPIAR
jgi:hypothetical protein